MKTYQVNDIPSKWDEIVGILERGEDDIGFMRGDVPIATALSRALTEKKREESRRQEEEWIASHPGENLDYMDPHEWDKIYAEWKKEHPDAKGMTERPEQKS